MAQGWSEKGWRENMAGGDADDDDDGGRNNFDDGILGVLVILCVLECWDFASDDDGERIEGMYFGISPVVNIDR